MEASKVIMGVDPGTNIMGYGIIEVEGSKIEMLSMGVVMLNKLNDHTDKLKKIFERTLALVEQYTPDEMAVEAPFFGKNVQSMLKLGRAQGVVMAAALYRQVPIIEYSPRKIKQSITGNGNASKEQVAALLCSTLNIKMESNYMDASDGLAVALCHHYQNKFPGIKARPGNSWEQFIRSNPNRTS